MSSAKCILIFINIYIGIVLNLTFTVNMDTVSGINNINLAGKSPKEYKF